LTDRIKFCDVNPGILKITYSINFSAKGLMTVCLSLL
jgi:hypothetical protein